MLLTFVMEAKNYNALHHLETYKTHRYIRKNKHRSKGRGGGEDGGVEGMAIWLEHAGWRRNHSGGMAERLTREKH